MTDFDKILYTKNFETSSDFEEFNIEIENSLSDFIINYRKKILFSVTELIQNNIIHNNSRIASLEIKSKPNKIEIVFLQYVSECDFTLINDIVAKVNSFSKEEVSKKIVDNIIFPPKETGSNNGFFICRQKTGNPIKFELIEKLSINGEIILKCATSLTIPKHDQNN